MIGGLNVFGDGSGVSMFTFMGMCGELLLYQRIFFPGKGKVFFAEFIFQYLPDLCRELFLRGFPYPRNAIVVVVCPLNSLVKSHIRELHIRRITAK